MHSDVCAAYTCFVNWRTISVRFEIHSVIWASRLCRRCVCIRPATGSTPQVRALCMSSRRNPACDCINGATHGSVRTRTVAVVSWGSDQRRVWNERLHGYILRWLTSSLCQLSPRGNPPFSHNLFFFSFKASNTRLVITSILLFIQKISVLASIARNVTLPQFTNVC